VVVGALSFLVAAYLVNMTFINEILAKRGALGRVHFPPTSVDMFIQVLAANFGMMKLVFLAIRHLLSLDDPAAHQSAAALRPRLRNCLTCRRHGREWA
jgi:hypothetical protein